MIRRYVLAATAAILATLWFCSAAGAANFVVMNTNDSGPESLRDAIAQANSTPLGLDPKTGQPVPHNVLFGLPAGATMSLTSGPIVISNSVNINNTSPINLTVERNLAAAAFGIFEVDTPNPVLVQMNGMNIFNGQSSMAGALNIKEAHHRVILSNMFFKDNKATGTIDANGGAIRNSGVLGMNRVTFEKNTSSNFGGAVYNGLSGTIAAQHATFVDNKAGTDFIVADGGGMYNAGQILLFNSTFCKNTATGDGGGFRNNGTTAAMVSNELALNTAGLSGPDVYDTLGSPITGDNKNIVLDPGGHMLDPARNIINVDPNFGDYGNNGGQVPTKGKKFGLATPSHDQGDNPVGYANAARGEPREHNGAADIGATESAVFAADSGNYTGPIWVSGTLPTPQENVMITGGQTVTATSDVTVGELHIGTGGGNSGAGMFRLESPSPSEMVTLTANRVSVGSAETDGSSYARGTGDAEIIGNWFIHLLVTFYVGDSTAITPEPSPSGFSPSPAFGAGQGNGGEPMPIPVEVAEANGTVTMTGSSATVTVGTGARIGNATAFSLFDESLKTATANGTLNINAPDATFDVLAGGTQIGTANAFSAGATADATASLSMVGQSTQLGQLTAAQASSVLTASASASAQVDIDVTGNIAAGNPTIGAASGNGQVGPSTVNLTGDQIIFTGSALLGQSTSATAMVEQVDFSATANLLRTSSGNFTLGQVSDGHVGSVHADVTAQTFEVILELRVGTVNGSSVSSMRELDDASLVVHGGNFSVNNTAFVGTMNVFNGANAAIHSARLEVLDGSFSSGTLTIASLTGTAAGLAELTATARFENTAVNVFNNVSVAVTNSAGAAAGSFVNGTLELVGSEMTARRSVRVGLNDGAGVIDTFGTIALNPSFLDIGDDLILGDGATLAFGIEGLTRPALGMPGQYGAIDADNATLDGQLVLDFDFVGVALGDMFELLRLDPAGMFMGFFDDTTVMGLPPGLTAEAAIVGKSVFATVVMIPPLPGDYNQDGTVNAADYTVWQDNLGAPAGTLPNEVDGGTIGQAQYNTWKANFGQSLGSGSGATGFASAFRTLSRARGDIV